MRRTGSGDLIVSLIHFGLLACVSISYLPGILFTPTYSMINRIIFVGIIICLFVNFSNIGRELFHKTILYGFLILALVAFVYLFYDELVLKNFLNILIAFSCFLLGYIKQKTTSSYIWSARFLFCVFALYMGMRNVMETGGFEIQDLYAISLKNSSGAILGTAAIISMVLLLGSRRLSYRIVYLIITLLLLACLLTFRNRSTMVGVFCSFFVLFAKGMHQMKHFRFYTYLFSFLFITFIAISILDIPVNQYIYQSMFANKGTTDMNQLSSGRLEIIADAWNNVIKKDPIGCNLSLKREMGCIDCFPVSVYNFTGIWGIIGYSPLYLFLFRFAYRRIKTSNYRVVYPYLCLMMLLIVSFFEASFPFGPGTAVFATYYFCGIEERRLKLLHSNQLRYRSPKSNNKLFSLNLFFRDRYRSR